MTKLDMLERRIEMLKQKKELQERLANKEYKQSPEYKYIMTQIDIEKESLEKEVLMESQRQTNYTELSPRQKKQIEKAAKEAICN